MSSIVTFIRACVALVARYLIANLCMCSSHIHMTASTCHTRTVCLRISTRKSVVVLCAWVFFSFVIFLQCKKILKSCSLSFFFFFYLSHFESFSAHSFSLMTSTSVWGTRREELEDVHKITTKCYSFACAW